MRTITFRPLRRIKKTGKIVVASYLTWRKVMTADYNKFNLIIDDEYKNIPDDESVYDHKGDQIFFFNYNPADVPILTDPEGTLGEIMKDHRQYGIEWTWGQHVNYRMDGADCDGVPTFTHYTADNIATFYYSRIEEFEPLTAGMVKKWFGWFLYNLNNSYLQIGR